MAENLQEEASRKTLFPRASSVLEGVRYEHLVSGVAGGVVAAQILHPLDLIRIRFSGKLSLPTILQTLSNSKCLHRYILYIFVCVYIFVCIM